MCGRDGGASGRRGASTRIRPLPPRRVCADAPGSRGAAAPAHVLVLKEDRSAGAVAGQERAPESGPARATLSGPAAEPGRGSRESWWRRRAIAAGGDIRAGKPVPGPSRAPGPDLPRGDGARAAENAPEDPAIVPARAAGAARAGGAASSGPDPDPDLGPAPVPARSPRGWRASPAPPPAPPRARPHADPSARRAPPSPSRNNPRRPLPPPQIIISEALDLGTPGGGGEIGNRGQPRRTHSAPVTQRH